MIIGIAGKKRAGKDTCAHIIKENFMSNGTQKFEHKSFAEPIKNACKIMFDWNDDHVYGDLKEVIDERWGISPRQAMQDLGTEWAQIDLCKRFPKYKNITGRSIWVKRLIAEYNKLYRTKSFVISDVRFPHEVTELKKINKSYIIKINRLDLSGEDSHESENYIDELDCDYEITTQGSLNDLQAQLEVILKEIQLVPISELKF